MSLDSPSSRAGEAHGLRGIGEGLFTPNLAPRTKGKQVRSELDLLAREKRLTTAPEQRDGPLQVLMQNQKRSGRESEQGGKPVRVEPSPHRARYTKDLTVKTQTPGVTTEKGQNCSRPERAPGKPTEYILVEYFGDGNVFDWAHVADLSHLLEAPLPESYANCRHEETTGWAFPESPGHSGCHLEEVLPSSLELIGEELLDDSYQDLCSAQNPFSSDTYPFGTSTDELPLSSLYSHQPEYFVGGTKPTLTAVTNKRHIKSLDKQTKRFKRHHTPNTHSISDDHRHERVEGVIPFQSEAYIPGKTVSSLYLYHEGETERELFGNKIIQLNEDSRCVATACACESEEELQTLLDSGATHVMISQEFFEKLDNQKPSRFLLMKPVMVKLGDGRYIKISECATVVVKIQKLVFQFIAWIAPLGKGTDLIIGIHAMHELEGKLNAKDFTFSFVDRSQPLTPLKDITVKHGVDTPVPLIMGKQPNDLPEKGEFICYMRDNDFEAYKPIAIHFHDSIIQAAYINSAQDKVLKKDSVQGFVDLRSIGYLFLTEEELKDRSKRMYVFFEAGEEVPEKVRPKAPKIKGKRIASVEDKRPDKITTIRPKGDHQEPKVGKRFINGFWVDEEDLYPWLDPQDPRRTMTDSEIIRSVIDLSKSELDETEKEQVLQLCEKYPKVFSLRDEIGECSQLEVDLELKDNEPFFNRPYPIKESEKEMIDREMRRGCLLGILKKGLSSYSSPVMLIARKNSELKRIVSDFRVLNSRLRLLQCSMPLIKDAIQTLGAVQAEIASIIDLRDAFHTLKLTEKSQFYASITPYMGSPTYLYQRLPMGLSVSPAIFMYFITQVMDQLEDRQVFLAIMDDIMVNSKKSKHLAHLEELFKILIKYGLKISPKKIQMFMLEVVYMGILLSFRKGYPTIQPTPSKIEAINRITHLENVQDVRGFCGMVNWLSGFIKGLQELLVPIYRLQKKGVPFEWTQECQEAFDEIKKRLTSAPVLSMPTLDGHFVLVSDTSKIGTGAALYQEQQGRLKLIAYNSKKLNEAASRYSISELELHGLIINIKSFDHVLRGTEFDVVVDHSALVFILRGKKEPPTLRLKKMLEQLSQYHFTTRFLKGKEMFISDFLSRHVGDGPHTEEILPVAVFEEIPASDVYGPEELQALIEQSVSQEPKEGSLQVSTRSSRKELVGKDELDKVMRKARTRKQAEKTAPSQPPAPPVKRSQTITKPCSVNLGPRVDDKTTTQPPVTSQPRIPSIPESIKTHIPQEIFDILDKGENAPEIIAPSGPAVLPRELFRKPPDLTSRMGTDGETVAQRHARGDKLFPHRRPIEYRVQGEAPRHDDPADYRPPPKLLYRESRPMFQGPLKESEIVYKHLPNAKELKKNLESIRLKVVQDYIVPFDVKDLTQEIKNDPYFKPIYDYLRTGQVTTQETKTRSLASVKAEAVDYILIEKVLFRIEFDKILEEHYPQLCIPQKYLPMLLYWSPFCPSCPRHTTLNHSRRVRGRGRRRNGR